MFRISILLVVLCLYSSLVFGQNIDKMIQQADKKLFTEKFQAAFDDYLAIEKQYPNTEGIDYHKEISYLLSEGRGEPLDKILAYEKVKGKQDRIYYYWLGRIFFENYAFEKAAESFQKFLSSSDFKSESLIEEAEIFIEWANEAQSFYITPNDYEIVPLPSNVNTKSADISPSFFGENDELLYMSSNQSTQNGIGETFKVYHSTRVDETNWKDPSAVDVFGEFSLLNAKIEVVNKDGRAFIYKNGNLQYSEPSASGWSQPTPFSARIKPSMIESHFFINDDENVVLFSSDKGGEGINLFEVRLNEETGAWSEPKILPPTINSSFYEDSPYLSHDGKVLYFSSNRDESIGGYDIYKSEYSEETQSWLPPENMGYPLNTVDDEIHFQVNEDNISGYFSSNRLHSQGDYDIYFFKKEVMITIHGLVTDNKNNPLPNHKVSFRPSKYPDEAFSTTSDESGRYSTEIFLDEPFFVEIEVDGVRVHSTEFRSSLPEGNEQINKDFAFEIPEKHPSYEDLIVEETTDDIERQEEQLASLDLIGSKYRSASSIDINNIYFETGSAEITRESHNVIVKILEMLEDFPDIAIRIAGHTDNVGPADFNKKLSKSRADALKSKLVSMGVSSARIETVGYGESRPIVSNDNEFQGREINRRIEITVID